MLRALIIVSATAIHGFKVADSANASPVLKLRGGITAGDVCHGGALFLSGSVGVPALIGGADMLFKINYPGFDWDGYTSTWSVASKNYLDSMTRFFGGAILTVGLMQYFAKSVMDPKAYFAILVAAQVVFAALQVFFAAPNAAVPNVHYVYAGMNAVIAAAGAMALM